MAKSRKRRPAKSKSAKSGGLGWLALIVFLLAGCLWWWANHPGIQQRQSSGTPAPTASDLQPRPATNGSWAKSLPETIPIPSAPTEPASGRPAQTVFEAQLALDRFGISPGSLDGRLGSQTRSALRAFQRKENLPATGDLDAATSARLRLVGPDYLNYTITSNDLARLQPVSATWSGKSQQSALDYETLLELVSEKSHSDPDLIRALNPGLDWNAASAGAVVKLPNDARVTPPSKAAFIQIRLAEKTLEAFDTETNLLAHFPCSIARRVEKRPVGELHVAVVVPNPNYTFDPAIFNDSPEAREVSTKLIVPPGPNNPVGTVWIGLDKPGYGIHGTPVPEKVGRTESHGCFRLANWNAEYLLQMVRVGLPVYVVP